MQNVLIKSLSVLLTLYFTSLIVFKQNYFNVSHIMNALYIMNFILLMLISNERTYKTNIILNAYMLFVLFATASSLWSIDFDNTSFRAMQLFVILINLFIVYNAMEKFSLQNTFLNGILLASFVNYLLLLGLIPAPFDIYDANATRAIGTVGNANSLASIMITSIFSSIIYLHKEKQISKIFFYYQYVNIFLATYLIFLTVSKKGIIFGILLIFMYLMLTMKQPKKLLILSTFGAIFIVIILNFLNLEDLATVYDRTIMRFSALESQLGQESKFGSTGERKYFIELGWSLFQDKPLFGYGLATFRFLNSFGLYSHNNYIELLVGVGLIGTLIFYSMYFFLFKIIFKMKDQYLKILFSFFLMMSLSIQFALVTYGSKMLLFTLLFILVATEQENIKYVKENKKINE